MERYVYANGKRLRCGFTTGTCAAAAAKAAAIFWKTGACLERVSLQVPKGIELELKIEDPSKGQNWTCCAVRKDGGDDQDATHGILVYAKIEPCQEGFSLEGGAGVGRITLPGLEQPVGAPAINRVPRQMIQQAVEEVLGSPAKVRVTISVPAGVELASKTYNPRLGIQGGISILGTTGIVEPMSQTALIDTIRVELELLRAQGDGPVLLTPGNYGETFCQKVLGLDTRRSVLYGNFLGEAFDHTVRLGFSGVLLVGHIGKLVKLAGGIYQTHSRVADARMEILTAHAALAGGSKDLARNLMGCITTDQALDLLDEAGLLSSVLEGLLEKIQFYGTGRLDHIPLGVVLFSNSRGLLAMNQKAQELIKTFQKVIEEEPK